MHESGGDLLIVANCCLWDGTLNTVKLDEKFSQFSDHWNPRIVAELNGQQVKVAKLKGEFDWHSHQNEDELFWVIRGELVIELEKEAIRLGPNELYVVPRGVLHRPVAKEEVWVVLFEPATTVNTGETESERTRTNLERL